jgi:hypothetical protein
MTDTQKSALRCAYLDLKGSLEAMEMADPLSHDWKAHMLSICEIEQHFADVIGDLT